MSYWFKFDTRVHGRYQHRIKTVFNSLLAQYEYQLQKGSKHTSFPSWETIVTTDQKTVATKWSNELGLRINPHPIEVKR